MPQLQFRVYPYRWVVLLVYMGVVALNQLLWITFAAVTGSAVAYYGVSSLAIGLLSMSFMIVYLVVSVPASWAIDNWGLRAAVGVGAALTGVFGLLRGLAASDYGLVLAAQIGIAIGQPFILNAVTKVAARWFPLEERATAAGLGSLAIYVGIVTGLALTPFLTARLGLEQMLLVYGIAAVVAGLAFFALARERPPTPPCPPEQEARSLVFMGLRDAVRQPSFRILMAILFVGLGVLNSVPAWIEDIVRPRGFTSTEAGLVGGLMVAAGILGALVLPTLSDRLRRRVPVILLALAGATLGLIGVTYATGYGLLIASAVTLGFFLLSAGPIAFQYGAEITYPAPEGTTNGLLLLMGQVSGILFVLAMDAGRTRTGSMTASLVALAGLMVLALVLGTRLRESGMLSREQK
jgi:sugar phosphate permease